MLDRVADTREDGKSKIFRQTPKVSLRAKFRSDSGETDEAIQKKITTSAPYVFARRSKSNPETNHVTTIPMKYILDFDEVLFNTTALKEKMAELGIPESERGLGVFDRIATEDPEFDLKQLVFPGALAFLQEHGKDCVVVSSASSTVATNNTDEKAQRLFQEQKIALSGVTALVHKVRVVGVGKTEALGEVHAEYGDDIIFMDDREKYVREARALGIPSVWMDREGKGYLTSPEGVPTMLEFPRVGSFAEFVSYIETCKKKE